MPDTACRPRSIDTIFISHLHPDHHIDLVPMRHYLKYAQATEGSVPLVAPAGIRERYDVLNGIAGFLDPRTRWSIWRRSRRRATGT